MKRTILFFVTITLLVTLTLLAPPPARAAGILYTVNSFDDVADFTDGVCTLREAILSSNGGVLTNCGPGSNDDDTIEFSDSGTITLTADLPAINGNLTIDGGDEFNGVTLDGGDTYRILTLNSGKTLHVSFVLFMRGFASDEGGAIRSFGLLSLTSCKFISNASNAGGGAIYSYGATEINNSEFYTNNTGTNVNGSGGAIMNVGTLVLNAVKIQESYAGAGGRGGAVWSSGPLLVGVGSQFFKNYAGEGGGAIYATRTADTTTLTIGQSLFEENKATEESATGQGGAVLVDAMEGSIVASTFKNNQGKAGGAIFAQASNVTVDTVTLSGNQAVVGGGIYNKSALTLKNSTLASNTATEDGGGVYHYFGTMFMSNVTLSGNQAIFGGGLKNQDGTARLSNITLFGNSAGNAGGGGILNEGPSSHLYLTNVLVANSPTGGNCVFLVAPNLPQYNLSSDNTCDFGNGRNNLNLKLGPLANNGGSTLTHLPQPGSPAIDNGTDDDAPSLDQRGVLRPQGTFYDVGAVEVELCTAKPTGLKLKKPENNAPLTNPRPTLRWTKATCAKTYKVIVKNVATGKVAFQKGGLKVLQYQPDNPLPKGVTYKWFVKACNPDAPSASRCAKSETRKFTIQ